MIWTAIYLYVGFFCSPALIFNTAILIDPPHFSIAAAAAAAAAFSIDGTRSHKGKKTLPFSEQNDQAK